MGKTCGTRAWWISWCFPMKHILSTLSFWSILSMMSDHEAEAVAQLPRTFAYSLAGLCGEHASAAQ